MHFTNRTFLTAALAAVLLLAPSTVAVAEEQQDKSAEILQVEQQMADEIVAVINRERIDRGLEPLAVWPDSEFAHYIAENYDRDDEPHALFQSYRNPDGSFDQYGGRGASEVFTTNDGTALGAWAAWERSPGHYEAVTRTRYTHIVVGVHCRGTRFGNYQTVGHLLTANDQPATNVPVADPDVDPETLTRCSPDLFTERPEVYEQLTDEHLYYGAGAAGLLLLLVMVWPSKRARQKKREGAVRG